MQVKTWLTMGMTLTRFSLIKHPKLVETCREKGIAVEVCPISYVFHLLYRSYGYWRQENRNEILVGVGAAMEERKEIEQIWVAFNVIDANASSAWVVELWRACRTVFWWPGCVWEHGADIWLLPGKKQVFIFCAVNNVFMRTGRGFEWADRLGNDKTTWVG